LRPYPTYPSRKWQIRSCPKSIYITETKNKVENHHPPSSPPKIKILIPRISLIHIETNRKEEEKTRGSEVKEKWPKLWLQWQAYVGPLRLSWRVASS
jgi:hypothetical protein